MPIATLDHEVIAALRSGDEDAFAAVTEPFRRQLHVHCYRMLGSFDEAEEIVQETFLRAWRARGTFEGRASLRSWLYRIATNACLDVIAKRRPRRVAPGDEVTWLQPYPDLLLEPAAPSGDEPEAMAIGRETIESAFILAIQHLPPRQRTYVRRTGDDRFRPLAIDILRIEDGLVTDVITVGTRWFPRFGLPAVL